MNIKHLIGIALIVPLLALFFTRLFAASLSSFQIDFIHFVSLMVFFIALIDVFFFTFKKSQTKLSKR
ncbi:hypothetical protein A9Q98_04240 [Thalassotalea sp. 42_200_T64]|nr:hypothetical protein A9Q98_04240 [Thalassotalea sp. 42_200_T64]